MTSCRDITNAKDYKHDIEAQSPTSDAGSDITIAVGEVETHFSEPDEEVDLLEANAIEILRMFETLTSAQKALADSVTANLASRVKTLDLAEAHTDKTAHLATKCVRLHNLQALCEDLKVLHRKTRILFNQAEKSEAEARSQALNIPLTKARGRCAEASYLTSNEQKRSLPKRGVDKFGIFLWLFNILFFAGLVTFGIFGHYKPAGLCYKSRVLAKAWNDLCMSALCGGAVLLIGVLLSLEGVHFSLDRTSRRYGFAVLFALTTCLVLPLTRQMGQMYRPIVFEPDCNVNPYPYFGRYYNETGMQYPGMPHYYRWIKAQQEDNAYYPGMEQHIAAYEASEIAQNLTKAYLDCRGWTHEWGV